MAASAFSHDQLVEAFEARFDYLTARTLAAEAVESAGLGKAAAYDPGQLAKIAAAVEASVSRPQAILSRLGSAPVAKAEPAKSESVKPEPAKPETAKAAAPAEAAVAETAPAAPGDAAAKPAEAKPAEAKAAGDDSDKKGAKK